MLLAGFEPAIPANERPRTDALDRAFTGISVYGDSREKIYSLSP